MSSITYYRNIVITPSDERNIKNKTSEKNNLFSYQTFDRYGIAFLALIEPKARQVL